jgi:hypothetical protein
MVAIVAVHFSFRSARLYKTIGNFFEFSPFETFRLPLSNMKKEASKTVQYYKICSPRKAFSHIYHFCKKRIISISASNYIFTNILKVKKNRNNSLQGLSFLRTLCNTASFATPQIQLDLAKFSQKLKNSLK